MNETLQFTILDVLMRIYTCVGHMFEKWNIWRRFRGHKMQNEQI